MKKGYWATLALLATFGTQMAFAGSPDGHRYSVTAKRCGSTPVTLPQVEEYQFQSGNLARIYVSSDSDSSQCKSALAYLRAIESFNTVGDTYTETATLISKVLRTVCRNKVSGKPVNPPASDQTNAVAEKNFSLSLTSRGKNLTMQIVGSDECQNETLSLDTTQQ